MTDDTEALETFEVVVTHANGSTTVALRGEVDMSVAPALAQMLRGLVADGKVHLVLDLSGLAFIDSSGLSVFIAGNRAATAAGGGLRLRSPRPSTMRVLETTRLTDLIAVDSS